LAYYWVSIMLALAPCSPPDWDFRANRCSRGIGLGFVKALSESPENAILATCRNPEGSEELREIADASEDLINVVRLNQDKRESIEAAATTAEELLGDLPVDYIINNAAYVRLSISFVPRGGSCRKEDSP
jgi:NAD(P)-dependent dehydrogenase (short-subunit alcohol dehydrogenase family)